jgi:hypothetical protein
MTRTGRTILAGCAIALALPGLLSAQDTTRTRTTSERRIRVQKGEVVRFTTTRDRRADSLMRADSLRADSLRADSIARADSLALIRRDSIARADSLAAIERTRADSIAAVERIRADSIARIEAARRDSIARADSIAREEQLRVQRMRDRYLFNGSGWYIGISGGTANPTGDLEDLGYGTGVSLAVPIGWHPRSTLFGVRLDLGYSQFDGNSFTGLGSGGAPVTLDNADPRILSAVLNLTARMPLNSSRSLNLYGVGGAGLYHFRSYGPSSALGGFLGNDVLDPADESVERTRNKLGAQVGAGLEFGLGPASLFLESRLVNVFADRDDNVQFRDFFGDNRGKDVRWVPIVLGFNFR